jgi:hypothetical protein
MNQGHEIQELASEPLSPRPALAAIRHPVANDEEVESYARGLISGTLKSAPNVVGSLLARIRQLLQIEDKRSQMSSEIQRLNLVIRNRPKCDSCNAPLSPTCAKCQRDWES